jgi:hypothetical protein
MPQARRGAQRPWWRRNGRKTRAGLSRMPSSVLVGEPVVCNLDGVAADMACRADFWYLIGGLGPLLNVMYFPKYSMLIAVIVRASQGCKPGFLSSRVRLSTSPRTICSPPGSRSGYRFPTGTSRSARFAGALSPGCVPWQRHAWPWPPSCASCPAAIGPPPSSVWPHDPVGAEHPLFARPWVNCRISSASSTPQKSCLLHGVHPTLGPGLRARCEPYSARPPLCRGPVPYAPPDRTWKPGFWPPFVRTQETVILVEHNVPSPESLVLSGRAMGFGRPLCALSHILLARTGVGCAR